MWAIVPPPDLVRRIDAARKEFSEAFQCYKALKPPVHLTLFMPFKTTDETLQQHIDSFKSWLSCQPAFSISLKNFAFFERLRSPVVFIDVAPNADLKEFNLRLSNRIVQAFGLEMGRTDFHPHFTIGYRDVPPAIFPEIKRLYSRRSFSALIDVNSIVLFRHNGLVWELILECPLGARSTGEGASLSEHEHG
jgi:2'-5' RNA ligase